MRGWLYSVDEPEGKVFDGSAYHAALKAGWVDTPALLEEVETEETPAPAQVERKKPGPKPKAKG